MNLDAVAEELRAALDTIEGLRVPAWGADSGVPPFAVVGLPVQIEYDETAGRGSDRYPDVEIYLLMGKSLGRAVRAQLAQFAAGSGPRSVKAALESYPYTACDPDTVRVVSCEFEDVKFAGVHHLAAIFHVDMTGDGDTE